MNYKLLSFFIICSSGLHLDSIVAVPNLSKAEASHMCQVVYLIKKLLVPLSVHCNKSTAKQIILNCELCCQGSIDKAQHLMSSQKIFGIFDKIVDREQFRICYFFKSLVSNLPLLIEREILLREEQGVFKELMPFGLLFRSIIEKNSSKFFGCGLIIGSQLS